MFAQSLLVRFLLASLVVLALSAAAFGQVSCAESWVPGLSPHGVPNGPIDFARTLDIGSGPELFIACAPGGFFRVGDILAHRLAKFDGTAWTAIGTNSQTAPTLQLPYAMAAFDEGSGPHLFVAGRFSVPGSTALVDYVARWTGSGWTFIGGLADDTVRALMVFNDGTGPALIAGGYFTSIGGVPANRVARWNGTSWSSMGMGPVGPWMHIAAFEVFNAGTGPQLYAAGSGSLPVAGGTYLQRWNGIGWTPVGHPALTSVKALCSHDDSVTGPGLFVSGSFTPGALAPGNTEVARFDGSNWTSIGDFGQSTVGFTGQGACAFLSYDDGSGPALYIGGEFFQPPAIPAAWGLVRYRNNALSLLPGSPHNPPMRSLVAFTHAGITSLVAAGAFGSGVSPSDSYSDFLALWNGSGWSSLSGSWYARRATALAAFDDGTGLKLYVAGMFHVLGSVVMNGFGRLNGGSWEGSGSGGLRISCMTVFDDGAGPALYVAGITLQGANPGIYRWNGGSSFTSLGGSLLPCSVTSMAVWDDGSGPALWISLSLPPGFSPAQFPTLRCWRSNAWQSVPQLVGISGPDGNVSKLLVEPGPGGGLILAGTFSSIGGVTVANIAKLSPGYVVDPLGSGLVTPGVLDVARYDDGNGPKIWAFALGYPNPAASGLSVGTVSHFDGPGWSIDRTVPGAISGMLRNVPYQGGESLYLGAAIQITNTPASFSLDRFAAGSWTQFGADAEPTDALAVDDSNGGGVFVAGEFGVVGGVPSGSIAEFASPWPTILTHPASRSVGLGQPITLSVSASGPAPLVYQWFFNSSTQVPGATGPTLSIPSATFADGGAYLVNISNACGIATSHTANVAVRGCDLSLSQPFGPGVIAVVLSGGPPSAHAFTAISLDTANATNPGGGNLFGLHVLIDDAIAELLSGAPPFVTTLSGSGSSFWAAGPLPPSLIGTTVWGVSTLYDPATFTTIGAPSLIAHRLLQ